MLLRWYMILSPRNAKLGLARESQSQRLRIQHIFQKLPFPCHAFQLEKGEKT